MKEQTYHARVIEVTKEGLVLVEPKPYTLDDYQGTMALHTNQSRMYDRFGDKVDVTYFRKNQWVKFISNGVMTMSLPPQLNPTVLHEQMPMIQFIADIKAVGKEIEMHVSNNLGSFIEGEQSLSFFDQTIIFDSNNKKLNLEDLKPNDSVKAFAIASFFSEEPLIELIRLEKI